MPLDTETKRAKGPAKEYELVKREVTLKESLKAQGVSRRGFMKFCATMASLMALPPMMAPKIARALEAQKKPSVIWLSFQECTGCTESLTRSHSPTVEQLILDHVSLDYHHTLQAAAGHQAEAAREQAMKDNKGKYLVIVDGSIPVDNPEYSCIAGVSNLDMLIDTAKDAAAIVSVGTCAAFGGLPMANPNPTGARAVSDIIKDKPIINVSGCPPIPVVITGVLTHYITFGTIPELDELGRPKVFFGDDIHDRCYRRGFYDQGLFAEGFDDEGARKGWCLYKLGCKGPITQSACATVKWNGGVSFPIQSGHPCLGCTQPNFWDGGGFYKPYAATTDATNVALGAAAVGAAAGIAGGMMGKSTRAAANQARQETTLEDVESKA